MSEPGLLGHSLFGQHCVVRFSITTTTLLHRFYHQLDPGAVLCWVFADCTPPLLPWVLLEAQGAVILAGMKGRVV